MTPPLPMFLGAEDFSPADAGVKAGTLHELAVAGFAVPAGFVLAPSVPLDDCTDSQLAEWVQRIGGFPVAVGMASGAAEDLAGASFAGVYESYLTVGDVRSLRQRITDCRDSAQSDRVARYLTDSGQHTDSAQLSVLVQSQVNSRTSGVGFTIDPLSGIEDFGVVEYTAGLGERLVSGRVTGTRLTVRLSDGLVVQRTEGSESAVCGADEVTALARLMVAAQAHRGSPQDIEWAIDSDGELWMLQSRPITAVSWRTDRGQYTDADFRDGGVSARVCTPLMYSLYRNAFQDTMQGFFVGLGLQPATDEPEWIAIFYGRPYWNVEAVKRCFTKVPGWSEREFDADLGVNKEYGDSGPLTVPVTVPTVLRALPVAVAVARQRRQKLLEVDTFASRWLREYGLWQHRSRALSQVSDSNFARDLATCLLGFQLQTECLYFSVIYNNTVLQSDFRKLLDDIDKATGGTSAVIDLIGGLAGISHMDMQRGIVKLYQVCRDNGIDSAEAASQMTDFLDRNGFHADIELELRCPRWSEDPGRVREMIRSMLEGGTEPADPDVTLSHQRHRYELARAEVRDRLRRRPLARLRFGRALEHRLDEVRRYLVARERMREYSAQAYALVRAYVTAAGARLAACGILDSPDDVFMLSVDELVGLTRDGQSTDPNFVDTVRFRRALYDGYRHCEPPHELGSGVQPVAPPVSDDCLNGLGCSPGRIEGTARVLRSLREIDKLTAGDILVTQYTDPGWTPALGLVAGVVTQVGGMLSHAAVISREYGIPAVLNVANVMSLVQSGQRVRIDGLAGTVEILTGIAGRMAL